MVGSTPLMGIDISVMLRLPEMRQMITTPNSIRKSEPPTMMKLF